MDKCALCGSSAHVYLVLGAPVPVCTVHDVDGLLDDSEHLDIGRPVTLPKPDYRARLGYLLP